MKKVMYFIGCALFVAAMTVACGGNDSTNDSNDSNAVIDSNATTETVDNQAEPTNTDVTVDNSAREAAIAEAAEKICNCASGDQTKIQECLKSIITSGYAAYQNDEAFTKAVYDKALKCAAEKAVNKAVEKGTEKAAEELSKQLSNIKL